MLYHCHFADFAVGHVQFQDVSIRWRREMRFGSRFDVDDDREEMADDELENAALQSPPRSTRGVWVSVRCQREWVSRG